MNYKFRGRLAPLMNALIFNVTADSELEALGEAAKVLKSDGYDLSKVSGVKVAAKPDAKSRVYVGAVPTKRKGPAKSADQPATPATAPAAQVPAAPTAQAPATPAKPKAEKPAAPAASK